MFNVRLGEMLCDISSSIGSQALLQRVLDGRQESLKEVNPPDSASEEYKRPEG